MSFAVGALVRARGREWLVLPDSSDEMLLLRPLGGSDAEVTGIYLPAGEDVESATFSLPDPERVGDFQSCRLLRDAVRLNIRSGAGPFRSFAGLGIEPRPYQLVPLLLALRLDPVRLLIADDVGIGKTIEACLVAKELIERREADGLCVLVPPHLAEQWQRDLKRQFHIDAELVLPSTAGRLERGWPLGQSLFDIYRHTVVSMDYVKSQRHRDEFLRTCPNLVIVDEAHTCASGNSGRGRQLRHELLRKLAEKQDRHLLLVTATPHSGNEEAFRSLLTLLNPSFETLPADLTGAENESQRRELARYLVQRRRPDIQQFLGEDTPFPERDEKEETYELTPAYRRFFDMALAFARETVEEVGADRRRQRVRWWSALALLRSIGSSPAAAASTLRNRAPELEGETPQDVDDIGERAVLDADGEDIEDLDLAPGSDFSETETDEQRVRRRLLELAREADDLVGPNDRKLQKFLHALEKLVAEGFNPIVFCRFIPTAEYVADAARKRLGKKAAVDAVTGLLAPEDRELRVAELAEKSSRVLVCTDCLSEGINLQQGFDAVVHYDLSWNPTRHEQREGRVDRFGQPKKKVRTVLYYGSNSPIDGLVLDVLLRKHKSIRTALGVSVPMPADTSQVMKALAEGLLLRGGRENAQGMFEFAIQGQAELHASWVKAGEREKRSRTLFAQQSIKPDEVRRELVAARRAIGGTSDVENFVLDGFKANGGAISTNGSIAVDLSRAPIALRDMIGGLTTFKARFELPVKHDILYLTRTHPVVAGLASYTLDTALDGAESADARRCGVIRTDAVNMRTTLLLVRERFHIIARDARGERPLLAEDCTLAAFTGSPEAPTWLDLDAAERLLGVLPKGNIAAEQSREFVEHVRRAYPIQLQPHLESRLRTRADDLLEAHQRVRAAAKLTGVRYRVEPKLPIDLLGIYVLLPVATATR